MPSRLRSLEDPLLLLDGHGAVQRKNPSSLSSRPSILADLELYLNLDLASDIHICGACVDELEHWNPRSQGFGPHQLGFAGG